MYKRDATQCIMLTACSAYYSIIQKLNLTISFVKEYIIRAVVGSFLVPKLAYCCAYFSPQFIDFNEFCQQFLRQNLTLLKIIWVFTTHMSKASPKLSSLLRKEKGGQCTSNGLLTTVEACTCEMGMVCVEIVSWPSGLAYRTQVLVLAAECGFESRPWHLCPWARHLTIIASLHPGVKWVPVRAELVD